VSSLPAFSLGEFFASREIVSGHEGASGARTCKAPERQHSRTTYGRSGWRDACRALPRAAATCRGRAGSGGPPARAAEPLASVGAAVEAAPVCQWAMGGGPPARARASPSRRPGSKAPGGRARRASSPPTALGCSGAIRAVARPPTRRPGDRPAPRRSGAGPRATGVTRTSTTREPARPGQQNGPEEARQGRAPSTQVGGRRDHAAPGQGAPGDSGPSSRCAPGSPRGAQLRRRGRPRRGRGWTGRGGPRAWHPGRSSRRPRGCEGRGSGRENGVGARME
jgi:hypothetical protein